MKATWYNISRSSEFEVLKNVQAENEPVDEQEKKFPQVQGEPPLAPSYQESQGTLLPRERQVEERARDIEDLNEQAYAAETLLATSLTSAIQKMSDSRVSEMTISPYSTPSVADNNKGWLPRKRLADFHPLTEEEANLKELSKSSIRMKLLKAISVSEHMKTKILEQVQAVYGNKIKQLQIIIPFVQTTAPKQQIQDKNNGIHDLSGLTKLDPDSVWYKVRRSLIEEHGQYADNSLAQ